ALELRGALLDIGREAFLRVLALEELLLELALERETGLEGDLRSRLHRALDEPDGHGRAPGWNEAPRVGEHGAPPLLRGAFLDLVDEPEPLGLFEGECLAGGHELDRARLADDARETLRAAGARQDAEVHLGQADFAGPLARDAD